VENLRRCGENEVDRLDRTATEKKIYSPRLWLLRFPAVTLILRITRRCPLLVRSFLSATLCCSRPRSGSGKLGRRLFAQHVRLGGAGTRERIPPPRHEFSECRHGALAAASLAPAAPRPRGLLRRRRRRRAAARLGGHGLVGLMLGSRRDRGLAFGAALPTPPCSRPKVI
jgi:hypothetical protein